MQRDPNRMQPELLNLSQTVSPVNDETILANDKSPLLGPQGACLTHRTLIVESSVPSK